MSAASSVREGDPVDAIATPAQVISRGEAHAVVDAGHKAHAIDSGMPAV